MSLIAVERDGAVAIIRLDRDEKLNAISSAMERELSAALASDEVRASRAVVIAGTGRAFSAGADITELAGRDPESILRYYRETGNVYEELASLPQPTLAAIHGYCLGGGLELALAADFRIADASAVLGFPEVGIGILPSSGGTARATRLLGAARAKSLILLGDRVSADEAFAVGLVTEVAADAPARALELARRLAELPPAALAVAKAAIDAAAESSHDAALLVERLGYAVLSQIPLP
ncbi:MAG TPA: enoyl-CoA hydratase/isomerase family protein [Gaiellaceae bacterium]|nr:enoyl-CoA hydratase/isomerase family protein [Gaiellaceae bacterium]